MGVHRAITPLHAEPPAPSLHVPLDALLGVHSTNDPAPSLLRGVGSWRED